MPEILLIRHAESEANVAGIWQGRGDAGLSRRGMAEVESLRRRPLGPFDLVASSPLRRATETAAALSSHVVVEPGLVEIDVGDWEGIAYSVVAERDADLLAAVYAGEEVAFGKTGESMTEVAERAWTVIEKVAAQVGDAGRAALVTHGGVIDSVVGALLTPGRRRMHRMVANGSVTEIAGKADDWRLARFNDTAHLGRLSLTVDQHLRAGHPVLALVRHGRTRANLENRFQGQSCWGLDEVGRRQAESLARWYGPVERLYSSPLARAMMTAEPFQGAAPQPEPGLMELGLGVWEGLTWDQVFAGWPDLVARIFDKGEDLPRGETGETWAGAGARFAATIDRLDLPPGEVTTVITHGGVMRSYLGTLAGDAAIGLRRLATPANASVSHLALTSRGPLLCDYAVTPHLI
jgi:broad specificity phosphatase PhoE